MCVWIQMVVTISVGSQRVEATFQRKHTDDNKTERFRDGAKSPQIQTSSMTTCKPSRRLLIPLLSTL